MTDTPEPTTPSPEPSTCTCTGTRAGLNACVHCPTPWPDFPGATRITRPEDVAAALASAFTSPDADPVAERLAELSRLEPGWLDGAGKKIEQSTLQTASRLIAALPAELHPIYIYPTERGGIELEWRDVNGTHSIEVEPGAKLFLQSDDRPVDGTTTGTSSRTETAPTAATAQASDPPAGDTPKDTRGRDDTMREAIAGALHEAHREWMRPGSDAGQRPLMDAGTDAVMGALDAGNLERAASGSSKPAVDLNEGGMRQAIAAVIDEGFRTFDADKTEDASLIESVTDSVLAFMQNQMQGLRDRIALLGRAATERAALLEEARDALEQAGEPGAHADDWPQIAPGIHALHTRTETAEADLTTARATNQRLNLRCQQAESELATYRRAVGQWDVSERGTYIPHASLVAIGKAAGADLLGSPRHLRHFQRVEQAEAAIARVRQLHDRLTSSDELTAPDDQITRGAAAKSIAAALDGWTPPALTAPAGQGDGSGK